VDDVDRIIEAWGREAPELDVRPLAVLSRVTRLARRLDLIRKEAFAAHSLDNWEFDVLASLRRAGPPYELSPGQLISLTLSTSGTMTNRIDRLAQRNLVTRLPDKKDRRGVRVRITAEGRELVRRALEDLLAEERKILAVLDAGEREELASQLRRLLDPFEADEASSQ
jgi:DNA-binding MarR family transcriptional regulator